MRTTKQRACIKDVFSHSKFALSAEELLQACQKKLPNIGIATIHREIKRLREENSLEEVKIPGDPIRFCYAGKHHHHHFKCKVCDTVFDIPCTGEDIKLPKGFKKSEHQINLFGTCSTCGI